MHAACWARLTRLSGRGEGFFKRPFHAKFRSGSFRVHPHSGDGRHDRVGAAHASAQGDDESALELLTSLHRFSLQHEKDSISLAETAASVQTARWHCKGRTANRDVLRRCLHKMRRDGRPEIVAAAARSLAAHLRPRKRLRANARAPCPWREPRFRRGDRACAVATENVTWWRPVLCPLLRRTLLCHPLRCVGSSGVGVGLRSLHDDNCQGVGCARRGCRK